MEEMMNKKEAKKDKKNVNLKICTRQYSESLELHGEAYRRELNIEDEMEILTEGEMYAEGGTFYISYDESEKTGFGNTKAVIKFSNDELSIKRYGESATGEEKDPDLMDLMDLKLVPGMVNITRYKTPVSTMDLEIYTNKLTGAIDDNGCGTISADYNVKLDTFLNMRNKLEIKIRSN